MPPRTYSPLVYALDVLIPIVEFGQRTHWHPTGPFAIWHWLATLAGGALTTAVVAGITNAFRRP